MKFSDETLMAYADGELQPAERAEVEAAMAQDPAVARAVERHRALAARVRGAYDDVLAEPVPARLASLVAGSDSTVTDLATRRRREGAAAGSRPLPGWIALAASVTLGLFAGLFLARSPRAPFAVEDGALIAQGALDSTLSAGLASAPGTGEIRIGISFRSRDGDYCRTFHLQQEAPLAGLACRHGDAWRLEVLAAATAQEGGLRPAAAMPIAVLRAVDATIEGEPLDSAAEIAARDAGWRNAAGVAE